MTCRNLISYTKDMQIKIHKKPTKNSEVCGGTIFPSIMCWDTERYGQELAIEYTCGKCHKKQEIKGLPIDEGSLSEFLLNYIKGMK